MAEGELRLVLVTRHLFFILRLFDILPTQLFGSTLSYPPHHSASHSSISVHLMSHNSLLFYCCSAHSIPIYGIFMKFMIFSVALALISYSFVLWHCIAQCNEWLRAECSGFASRDVFGFVHIGCRYPPSFGVGLTSRNKADVAWNWLLLYLLL
jgi:hypothetical protein